MTPHVVVVGGSIAALTAAETLRLDGHDGPITLLSDEGDRPYSRVPLSKAVLAGEEPPSYALLLAPAADIDIRLGCRADRLDTVRRRIVVAGGEEIGYDKLVIATGARARRLSTRPDELVLRTLDDAAALGGRIAAARSVLVVGGGFLGMEIASTCRSLGKTVTVIDRDPPLLRLLGPWLADVLTSAARDLGIGIVHAPEGVELIGSPGIEGARHAGGTLTADVVISAVGDVPNIEWLHGSGLELAGGVVVDGSCRATADIVAAGDVAVRRVAGSVQPRRPHWTNAVEQGRAAARALLASGDDVDYVPDPYFWTRQCGLDVKISGELPLTGEPTVLDGDVGDLAALLQWPRRDGLTTAVALNHKTPVIKLKALGHQRKEPRRSRS